MHSDGEVLYRADGTTFPAEYWSYPVRRDGRTDGAVVTFLDITDRKQAESGIRTAARRREQFLAMLSHELRNPLAAVLAATKLMQTRGTRDDGLALARDVVERQAGHMARLLDNLLDVSRITRGGIELRQSDLDLRDIIRTAVEAVDPLVAHRRSDLVVEVPATEASVRGDPTRLQQVVGNLLSNSARYSEPGTPIRLTLELEREEVVLRVEDQGCGIPTDMLSDIFELFVQAEQALDRPNGGLGVGLTLVRQIVDLHEGSVVAHSEGPGKGCMFVVRLPRDRRAVVAPIPIDGSRRSARVVVVEDQPDSRLMMRLLLEGFGHVVIDVGDGQAALDVIARERPDAALVDIGLPVTNGYEVARALRKNPLLDDVLLVALTGYGTAEDIRAARESGFDDHLTKPADPEQIERVLSRRRTMAT